MSKINLNRLLEKLPNRYVLAILTGKKYREHLQKCTENNIYISHDKIYGKVINESGEESLDKFDYLNPKEGI